MRTARRCAIAVVCCLALMPLQGAGAAPGRAFTTIACTTNTPNRAGKVMAVCSDGHLPNNIVVLAPNSTKLSGKTLAQVVAMAQSDLDCTGCVGTVEVGDGSVTVAKLAATPPSAGQVLSFDGTDLEWTDPASGSGDITSVGPGTGLSGGGTAGDVTLSVAPTYRLPQGC